MYFDKRIRLIYRNKTESRTQEKTKRKKQIVACSNGQKDLSVVRLWESLSEKDDRIILFRKEKADADFKRQNWHIEDGKTMYGFVYKTFVEPGWFYQLEVYSAFLMLLSGRCWVYPSFRRMQPRGAKPIKMINMSNSR